MSTKAWLAVTSTILVIALGALVHVQLFWINQLSRGQLARERSLLDFAAHQIPADLEHDVHRAMLGFQGAAPFEVPERLEQWRAAARDPHIIRAVYIVRGDELLSLDAKPPAPIAWPPELAPIRDAERRGDSPFYSTIPALFVPLRPMPPPMERMPEGMRPRVSDATPQPRVGPPSLIVEFDRAYLANTYFPEIVRRVGEPYDIVITDGTRPVYTNSKWDGRGADATAKFLRFFHDDEDNGGWTVLLRRHGTRIEIAVHSIRVHNLYIGGVLLALLLASFIILGSVAHRSERLRRQQLELVAGLTHELNTPLAAIRSAGQNLADGVVTDSERVVRYGSMINREATRLGDLVAQVLDYSGLQRGVRNRASVDVAEVVHAAIEQTRWLADEQHVVIEPQIASDLPHVSGDADALTRALQNLIANAIRHGGDGKWVGVRAEHADGAVAITVEDRGIGIAPRDVKHLFDPFYRGSNAKARGTGLGLTIVRQIARAHDGSVSLDPHRERGAAFTLRIPVAHG